MNELDEDDLDTEDSDDEIRLMSMEAEIARLQEYIKDLEKK